MIIKHVVVIVGFLSLMSSRSHTQLACLGNATNKCRTTVLQIFLGWGSGLTLLVLQEVSQGIYVKNMLDILLMM